MAKLTNKPTIIGFDVDSTLADSLWTWLTWGNAQVSENRLVEPLCIPDILKAGNDFDWGVHGSIMQTHLGISNPWEFWHLSDLYDRVEPFTNAVNWMKNFRSQVDKMNAEGHNIKLVVVTTCSPTHESSKRLFIEHYFPNIFDGFISTGDKHLCGLDIIFDDKGTHCLNCLDNGTKIAVCPEVGLNRPSHGQVIAPVTEYGGFWNYMMSADPHGIKLMTLYKNVM
ncbi:putative 5' nucleotidase [Vibrio phage VP-1]|uniref:Putative 5' nucleotidase n=1 Tax=Vibrio phage VP-1 TaxID=2234088 RepID=A0A4P2TJI3_9CAUD|nr:putative 5' nucleotidase [Vibrio phage VP-1]